MRVFDIRSAIAVGAAVAVSTFALSVSTSAQKKGQTQVPLRVVVQASHSAGEVTQITGDGRGSEDNRDPNEYVHGVDGVTAVLNESGGISIDFQSSALSPRRLHFDYSHPANPAFRPELEPAIYSGLRTHLDSTNVPLPQMAVGSSQCIRMGIAFSLGDAKQTAYRNSYQANNIASVDSSGTAFGALTRTTDDAWVLESRADGMCNSAGTAHLGKLVSNATSKGKPSG
jgi:hypothetical protein